MQDPNTGIMVSYTATDNKKNTSVYSFTGTIGQTIYIDGKVSLFDEDGYDIHGWSEPDLYGEVWNRENINKLTGTQYTRDGYDKDGWSKADSNGQIWNRDKINKETNTIYDSEGYARDGFNSDGWNRDNINKETNTIYDTEGYARDGFNSDGWNRDNINQETNTIYDIDGYDRAGFNTEGWNRDNINKETGTLYGLDGYDRDGYNTEGYDISGWSRPDQNNQIWNKNNINKTTGTIYDTEGYTRDKENIENDGFNAQGYNRTGYDINGYDKDGYNREGFNVDGWNRNNINKETNTIYDKEGYAIDGFNSDGWNRDNINKDTNTIYDNDGYARDGFNSDGWNRDNINKDTNTIYDTEGYARDGFNSDGWNRDNINKETNTIYDKDGYARDGFNVDGWNRDNINKETNTIYDKNGYARDEEGIVDGFNEAGWNRDSINQETGTIYDIEGYARDGFNADGWNRDNINKDTNTIYDTEGYARDGFNADGWNRDNINKDTNTIYDTEGYARDGFNSDGWNRDNINKETNTIYDTEGYARDEEGIVDGFNETGWNRDSINQETGTIYDIDGYAHDGFNADGWNKDNINKETNTIYDSEGYARDGFNSGGWNRDNINKETNTIYDSEGYAHDGFNSDGWNRDNINKDTNTIYDNDGYARDGFNSDGWNRDNINKETNTIYDKDGYARDGFNVDGWNRDNINKETGKIYDNTGWDRNHKTRYGEDGKPVNGVLDNTNYVDGKASAGTVNNVRYGNDGKPVNGVLDNTNYVDGKASAGTVNNVRYGNDGKPVNGVIDGTNYVDGKASAGTVNNVRYGNDGKPANGVIDNTNYKAGVPSAGIVEGVRYGDDGKPFNGTIKGINYVDGVAIEDNIDEVKYDENGRPLNGFAIVNNERLLFYNGKKLLNGILMEQTYWVNDNGSKFTGSISYGVYTYKKYVEITIVPYIEERYSMDDAICISKYATGDSIKTTAADMGKEYFPQCNSRFYLDGKPANGVIKDNFDEDINYVDGIASAGIVEGVRYGENGKAITGFVDVDDKSIHYSAGIPTTGFVKVSGKSVHYTDGIPTTGFVEIDNKSVHYTDGIPTNGFVEIDDKSIHYTAGIPTTGLVEVDDTELMYQDGKLLTGKSSLTNEYYIDGTIADNATIGDNLYEDGQLATGDDYFDNIMYREGQKLTGFSNATGENIYYLNGEKLNGSCIEDENRLYKDGKRYTGFNEDKTTHYTEGKPTNGLVSNVTLLDANTPQTLMYQYGKPANGVIDGTNYVAGVPSAGIIEGVRYGEDGKPVSIFVYDEEGYDEEGYDQEGYNQEGWSRPDKYGQIWNRNNINQNTQTIYDKDGYDRNGWSRDGINKETKTNYDSEGYDRNGLDEFWCYRPDKYGQIWSADNTDPLTGDIYDLEGYAINGFNAQGWNRDNINVITGEIYDSMGWDRNHTTRYDNNGEPVNGIIDGISYENGVPILVYDEEGYDQEGYNQEGWSRPDKYGQIWNRYNVNKETGTIFGTDRYTRDGWNLIFPAIPFNRITGTKSDSEGYDRNGFNTEGINKETGTIYNKAGYDKDGYDAEGYDKYGWSKPDENYESWNRQGLNAEIYDCYDLAGYDKDGWSIPDENGQIWNRQDENKITGEKYDSAGFDRDGINRETGEKYSKDGYDRFGWSEPDTNGEIWSRDGINKETGEKYDSAGFDRDGINKETGNKYDNDGFDRSGWSEPDANDQLWNKYNLNKETGIKYAKDGYDRNGFDRNGIHRESQDYYDYKGYDKDGYDAEGYDKDGWSKPDAYGQSWNKKNINKENNFIYDKDGYDRDGFNADGWNRDGINIETKELYDINGWSQPDANGQVWNRHGINQETGTFVNSEGYDSEGYCNGWSKPDENGQSWSRSNINKETGTLYDKEGYNRYGYDVDGWSKPDENGQVWNAYTLQNQETRTRYANDGYNKYGQDSEGYYRDGFNYYGWNRDGINKITGTPYDTEGYDRYGYDRYGYDKDGWSNDDINKITGTPYDTEGYDRYGYDKDGYDREGWNNADLHRDTNDYYNNEGYDRMGYNAYGIDREGYDLNGYDASGFDRDGYDLNGYDASGFDRDGYDRNGNHIDNEGYDEYGYDEDGYDSQGYNEEGYDINGWSRYDENGQSWDIDNINYETKTQYDIFGYNIYGFNADGWNRDGINKFTGTIYNLQGYDIDGFNANGWNRDNINKETGKIYDAEGYDVEGWSETDQYGQSWNKNNINKQTGKIYDTKGYTRDRDDYDDDGYNSAGWNRDNINKETKTNYDSEGYNIYGFNADGWNRNSINQETGKIYDTEGYDINGWSEPDVNGQIWNRDNINQETQKQYDSNGWSRIDENGQYWSENNINKETNSIYGTDDYTRDGVNKQGFDRNGNDCRVYKNRHLLTGYDENGVLYQNGVLFTGDLYIETSWHGFGGQVSVSNPPKQNYAYTKEVVYFIYEENGQSSVIDYNLNAETKTYLGFNGSDFFLNTEKYAKFIDGKLAHNIDIDGQYYENGQLATGYDFDVNSSTMFLNGEKFSGEYENKIYIEGKGLDGVYKVTRENGEFVEAVAVTEESSSEGSHSHDADSANSTTTTTLMYQDGAVADNVLINDVYYVAGEPGGELILDGVYYKDGYPGTGSYQGKEYKNGSLLSGMKYSDPTDRSTGVMYQDGEVANNVVIRNKHYIDGKVAGTGVFEGQYFVDGELAEGEITVDGAIYEDGKAKYGHEDEGFYVGGKLFTGNHNGIEYENGQLFTGEIDGKQYFDGFIADGYYAGTVYSDGELANGIIDGVSYVDGNAFTGLNSEGIMYKNGVIASDNALVGNTLYENGHQSNFTGEIAGIRYENGKTFNGVKDGKNYFNGHIANGHQDGKYYINGIETESPNGNYVDFSIDDSRLPVYSYPSINELTGDNVTVTTEQSYAGSMVKTYNIPIDNYNVRVVTQNIDEDGNIISTTVEDLHDNKSDITETYSITFDANHNIIDRYTILSKDIDENNVEIKSIKDYDGTGKYITNNVDIVSKSEISNAKSAEDKKKETESTAYIDNIAKNLTFSAKGSQNSYTSEIFTIFDEVKSTIYSASSLIRSFGTNINGYQISTDENNQVISIKTNNIAINITYGANDCISRIDYINSSDKSSESCNFTFSNNVMMQSDYKYSDSSKTKSYSTDSINITNYSYSEKSIDGNYSTTTTETITGGILNKTISREYSHENYKKLETTQETYSISAKIYNPPSLDDEGNDIPTSILISSLTEYTQTRSNNDSYFYSNEVIQKTRNSNGTYKTVTETSETSRNADITSIRESKLVRDDCYEKRQDKSTYKSSNVSSTSRSNSVNDYINGISSNSYSQIVERKGFEIQKITQSNSGKLDKETPAPDEKYNTVPDFSIQQIQSNVPETMLEPPEVDTNTARNLEITSYAKAKWSEPVILNDVILDNGAPLSGMYSVESDANGNITSVNKDAEDGVMYNNGKVADNVTLDDGTYYVGGKPAEGTQADGKSYSNGKPLDGPQEDGKTYNNGTPANGPQDDGKTYNDGTPVSGKQTDGKNYTEGKPTNGIGDDGKYYIDGVPFSGKQNGKLYVDGKPVHGEYNGIVYHDGIPQGTTEEAAMNLFITTIESKLAVSLDELEEPVFKYQGVPKEYTSKLDQARSTLSSAIQKLTEAKGCDYITIDNDDKKIKISDKSCNLNYTITLNDNYMVSEIKAEQLIEHTRTKEIYQTLLSTDTIKLDYNSKNELTSIEYTLNDLYESETPDVYYNCPTSTNVYVSASTSKENNTNVKIKLDNGIVDEFSEKTTTTYDQGSIVEEIEFDEDMYVVKNSKIVDFADEDCGYYKKKEYDAKTRTVNTTIEEYRAYAEYNHTYESEHSVCDNIASSHWGETILLSSKDSCSYIYYGDYGNCRHDVTTTSKRKENGEYYTIETDKSTELRDPNYKKPENAYTVEELVEVGYAEYEWVENIVYMNVPVKHFDQESTTTTIYDGKDKMTRTRESSNTDDYGVVHSSKSKTTCDYVNGMCTVEQSSESSQSGRSSRLYTEPCNKREPIVQPEYNTVPITDKSKFVLNATPREEQAMRVAVSAIKNSYLNITNKEINRVDSSGWLGCIAGSIAGIFTNPGTTDKEFKKLSQQIVDLIEAQDDPQKFKELYLRITGLVFDPEKILKSPDAHNYVAETQAAINVNTKLYEILTKPITTGVISTTIYGGTMTSSATMHELAHDILSKVVTEPGTLDDLEAIKSLYGKLSEAYGHNTCSSLEANFKKNNGVDFSDLSLNDKITYYAQTLYDMTTASNLNNLKSSIEKAKSDLEKYKLDNNDILQATCVNTFLEDMLETNAKIVGITSSVLKTAAIMTTTIASGGIAGAFHAGALATMAITSAAAGVTSFGLELSESLTDNIESNFFQDAKEAAKNGAITALFTALGFGAGAANKAMQAILKNAGVKEISSKIIGEISELVLDTGSTVTASVFLGQDVDITQEAFQNLFIQVMGCMIGGSTVIKNQSDVKKAMKNAAELNPKGEPMTKSQIEEIAKLSDSEVCTCKANLSKLKKKFEDYLIDFSDIKFLLDYDAVRIYNNLYDTLSLNGYSIVHLKEFAMSNEGKMIADFIGPGKLFDTNDKTTLSLLYHLISKSAVVQGTKLNYTIGTNVAFSKELINDLEIAKRNNNSLVWNKDGMTLDAARQNSNIGDLIEHNGKIYVNDGRPELYELAGMTKKMMDELFPPGLRFMIKQNSGTCFFASTITALMKNETTVADIYKKFTAIDGKIYVNGIDINAKNILNDADDACLGYQLLSKAYAYLKSSTDNTPISITDTLGKGGYEHDVLDDFFGYTYSPRGSFIDGGSSCTMVKITSKDNLVSTIEKFSNDGGIPVTFSVYRKNIDDKGAHAMTYANIVKNGDDISVVVMNSQANSALYQTFSLDDLFAKFNVCIDFLRKNIDTDYFEFGSVGFFD